MPTGARISLAPLTAGCRALATSPRWQALCNSMKRAKRCVAGGVECVAITFVERLAIRYGGRVGAAGHSLDSLHYL